MSTEKQIIERALDREAALDFVGHDLEFLAELLDAFGGCRARITSRMEKAIREGDAAEMYEAAHEMKGALGNFHARESVVTARKLNDLARRGELDGAEQLYKTLREELDTLCEAVGSLVNEAS